jgi:hypothetical protein
MVEPLTKLHEPAAEGLTKSSLLVLEKAVRRTEGDDGEWCPGNSNLYSNHSGRQVYPTTYVFGTGYGRTRFTFYLCRPNWMRGMCQER